jgi:thiol-disulfide isomerase/thioredoxin
MAKRNKTRQHRWRGLILIGAALAVLGALSARQHGETAGDAVVSPWKAPAERAPVGPLAARRLGNGTPWSAEAVRGRVVLVNYWATWCGPCRREAPALVGLARRFAPSGLETVGVVMDEGSDAAVTEAVRAFERDTTGGPLPYPNVRLTERDPFLSFQGFPLPTTQLVDRRGRVARTYVGAITETQVAPDIERLLAEPH